MTVATPWMPPRSTAADLHLHTRASDGRWTPAALVERVAALGIGVMAVADHDTLDSIEEVTALATARGIEVITGVEVTTRWDSRQWHLLVYGATLTGTPFRVLVDDQRQRHIVAAERASAALRREGYDLPSLDEAIGGRPPLPIYVMSALLRDGVVESVLAANQFVTNRLGIPFYIDVPLREAVDAAHASGGLAVLAHPGRLEPEPLDEERLARMLREAPLDGLEVYYPTHTPAQLELYQRLADAHDLLRSCGSDSHGPGWPRDPIPYPAGSVAPLLARVLGDPA